MKSYIIILLACVFLIPISCKKDTIDENIEGLWDIEKYTIDGIDSTNFLKTNPKYSFTEFVYDQKYDNRDIVGRYNDTAITGFWHLIENIYIEYMFSAYNKNIEIPPFRSSNILLKWKIERIKKESEMILSIDYNNKNYEATYKYLRRSW